MMKQPLKSSIAALIFISASSLNSLPCYAASKWRDLARQANQLVDKKDYAAAIQCFDAAIAEFDNKPAKTSDYQCKYDLILNEADCYRRWDHLSNCKKLLDDLEPSFTEPKSWQDALLPARFWRRRSELYLSMGRNRDYALCQIKALEILRANLDQCHGLVSELMYKLAELKDKQNQQLVLRHINQWRVSDKAERKEIAEWNIWCPLQTTKTK